MAQNFPEKNDIVEFLRKRDYIFVRELGQGACGKTVLLYDDVIEDHFVCKKYAPHAESQRIELFKSFVQEVKLLHKVHHENLVRIFSYNLYPEQLTGYILMEQVEGFEVDDYLKQSPERTNEIFLQAIAGFAYLERKGILHRDIRPGNVMVRNDGIVKIIDLGFGKEIRNPEDFDKSISLNWWCQTPEEFDERRYDFRSEVYFVGKLFEEIIQQNQINHFKYLEILRHMCQRNPSARIASFSDIEKATKNDQFSEIEFTDAELEAYRDFSAALIRQVTKIDSATKYIDDLDRIQTQLNDAHRSFMLEKNVPNAAVVLRCFLAGAYYYRGLGLTVDSVRNFVAILRAATHEKRRIILANIHTMLDAVPRYRDPPTFPDESIPF